MNATENFNNIVDYLTKNEQPDMVVNLYYTIKHGYMAMYNLHWEGGMIYDCVYFASEKFVKTTVFRSGVYHFVEQPETNCITKPLCELSGINPCDNILINWGRFIQRKFIDSKDNSEIDSGKLTHFVKREMSCMLTDFDASIHIHGDCKLRILYPCNVIHHHVYTSKSYTIDKDYINFDANKLRYRTPQQFLLRVLCDRDLYKIRKSTKKSVKRTHKFSDILITTKSDSIEVDRREYEDRFNASYNDLNIVLWTSTNARSNILDTETTIVVSNDNTDDSVERSENQM